MYFTECVRLVERHPDLSEAVQQIDAQLAKIRPGGIIRAADLASFLGADPNQVHAVLEKLAQEKLLLAEEMLECSFCRMVVLRTEYQELQEEEGEYRCTSCDRLLTDTTVQEVITYSPSEKCKVATPDVATLEMSKPSENLIVPVQNYPKDVRVFLNQGRMWLVVYDGVSQERPRLRGHDVHLPPSSTPWPRDACRVLAEHRRG